MSQTCRECGGQLFVDERVCPRCRLPVPQEPVPHDPNGPGWLDPKPVTPAGPPPPPEGLELIIQKHRADQDARRLPHDIEDDLAADGPFPGSGFVYGGGMDIGEMMTPTRDRDGNIEWDLKYAIVGAIVVAVVVGLIAAYVFGGIGAGGSRLVR